MRIPKRYGQSKVDLCPFCNMPGVIRNKQGIPVCSRHKDKNIGEAKCACGSFLDLRLGKFGAYFHCINCGNISWSKAIAINDFSDKKKTADNKTEKQDKTERSRREITVRADELDFI